MVVEPLAATPIKLFVKDGMLVFDIPVQTVILAASILPPSNRILSVTAKNHLP